MQAIPLISFLTGVISILSPCILPVIPVFVAVSLNSKSKSEIMSFTMGMVIVFFAIAVLTGFFTSMVYRYMFYIRIVSAILLLAIGILMLEDYSFNLSLRLPENSDGIVGSFLLGLITSVSWAPCYGAYLISLISLVVATDGGLYGISNLLLYCLGFGLTLFALSFLISKINLEKLISKTKYVPKIFAALIILGALYLFWESFKVLI